MWQQCRIFHSAKKLDNLKISDIPLREVSINRTVHLHDLVDGHEGVCFTRRIHVSTAYNFTISYYQETGFCELAKKKANRRLRGRGL